MEIESNRTERIDPEFDIYIAKRLPYQLRSKYYSQTDMELIAKDLFELGIEYVHQWSNCYINLPGENRIVILKINENRYHVCRYKDKCYIALDGTKKVIPIDPNSRWRYVEYPNCRLEDDECGCEYRCGCCSGD